MALAQEPQDFLDQALYRHDYQDQRWAISAQELDLLVDNLVGVLAVISQPEFKRRHPLMGNLVLQQLGGTAHSFSLRTYSNQAQVTMERPGPKVIVYRAQITMQKLGLSVSGQMLIRVRLQYASPQDQTLRAEVTVAFRPASDMLAAALKPVMASFQEEMDRLGGKAMVQIQDFLRIYKQERHGSLQPGGPARPVGSHKPAPPGAGRRTETTHRYGGKRPSFRWPGPHRPGPGHGPGVRWWAWPWAGCWPIG